MSRKVLFVLGSAMLLIALLLAAGVVSGQEQEPQPDCGVEPCPSWIVEAWSGSGHADAEAEAFRHWDEEDVVEVPTSCAQCHSAYGYLDFVGADGSEAGVVDMPAPVDSVISCEVCHTPNAMGLESVTFPSGAVVTDLGESTRCAVCHQGRASGASVDAAIEGLPLDEVAELRFVNIHYFAAAASLYGSEVGGGYQYAGKAYQPSFEHVEGYDTCASCHDPHALELNIEECSMCHTGVASVEDVEAIRMPGSMVDYDGDGDVAESIKAELEGMQEALYAAIQAYAADVVGTPIVYDAVSYPYFFADDDGNGEVNGEEGSYASWTPRLLQAAYNFQTYEKDPGAFAHNARYYAQLMYDSVESLNEVTGGMAVLQRNPPGHFDGTAEAFRHWDEDGEVPASCTKCHSSEGLPFQAMYGTQIPQEPSTSLACASCHNFEEGFALYVTDEVTFPSGAVLSFGEGVGANLCINCHQGRESGASVDARIERAGVGDDETSEDLSFVNVHYFAAGATFFGSEAGGIYEYEGKEYAGKSTHTPPYDTCTSCHTAHTLTIKSEECTMCHPGVEDVDAIRMTAQDWDGDGAEEGVAGEIETLNEMLLEAIVAYSTDVVGMPIKYDAGAYPYWFNADEEGARYVSWTPNLLRAAYNYQYAAKDPGAFAHNGPYVAQALYDSIEAVGGDVSGLIRP
ncbi:MAG: hypothetical protein JXA10_15870 [Anaerolineae bacterium]|nr:hypothetical protein [Anaerolineae bacterium]